MIDKKKQTGERERDRDRESLMDAHVNLLTLC